MREGRREGREGKRAGKREGGKRHKEIQSREKVEQRKEKFVKQP